MNERYQKALDKAYDKAIENEFDGLIRNYIEGKSAGGHMTADQAIGYFKRGLKLINEAYDIASK